VILLLPTGQQAGLKRAAGDHERLRACAFRPPYGNYDAVALSLAQQRRMSVWLWSVDTQDWMARGSGSPFWVSRIIRLAQGEGGALRHPVVLMHNQPAGNPATVAALPVIIRFFRSHGYRFVRL
jgi:peptidoglycan/xylan/chitin deacetylase (PgdA/CDA1 family)